MKADLWL